MTKLRMELSCVEDSLLPALQEVVTIMRALNDGKLEKAVLSLELKVFHDRNRLVDAGCTWLTISHDSSAHDIQTIYNLKKRIREQDNELQKLKDSISTDKRHDS